MRFYKQTTLRATAFGRPALLPFTLLSILLPPPDRLAFVFPLPEFKTRMLLSKTTSWHSRNGSEMSPKWTQISTTLAEQNTMSTQKQWVCCVQSQRLLEPGSGCLPASRPRNLAAKLCQITLLIYMEDGIYLYAYIHTYIYIYIQLQGVSVAKTAWFGSTGLLDHWCPDFFNFITWYHVQKSMWCQKWALSIFVCWEAVPEALRKGIHVVMLNQHRGHQLDLATGKFPTRQFTLAEIY